MQARYQIRLYNISGAQVAVLDNWDNLEINKNVNGFHDHVLQMDLDDERVQYFTTDALLRIMRRIPGESWYEEYCGFHRTPHKTISEKGKKQFVSYGRGLVDLLRRRSLGYYATSAFGIKSGPGETVMKEFVNENAGPGANNALRLSNGVTLGLSIEGDSGRGDNWFGQRSYRNLLELLQEIALATDVDFDVVYLGANLFEFRCYYPCLGTDRTTTVKFAPELGNMDQPNYSKSRTEEGNVVFALGSGEGTSRHTLVRSTAAVGDSPWNRSEIICDARQEDTYNALNTAALEALEAAQAREEFNFQVIQTPGLQYGKDYFLGDLITARFEDVISVKKIVGIKIQVSEGKERIAAEFADL